MLHNQGRAVVDLSALPSPTDASLSDSALAPEEAVSGTPVAWPSTSGRKLTTFAIRGLPSSTFPRSPLRRKIPSPTLRSRLGRRRPTRRRLPIEVATPPPHERLSRPHARQSTDGRHPAQQGAGFGACRSLCSRHAGRRWGGGRGRWGSGGGVGRRVGRWMGRASVRGALNPTLSTVDHTPQTRDPRVIAVERNLVSISPLQACTLDGPGHSTPSICQATRISLL